MKKLNVAIMEVYDERLRERLRDGKRGAHVVREYAFRTGRAHWTEPHSSDVEGVARVDRLGTVDPADGADLAEYVDGSLFDSAEAWQNHIRKRHVWLRDAAHVLYIAPDDDDDADSGSSLGQPLISDYC
jgi:hypothetical protein